MGYGILEFVECASGRRPSYTEPYYNLFLHIRFRADTRRVYDDSVAYARIWESDTSSDSDVESAPVVATPQDVTPGVVSPGTARADIASGEAAAKSIDMNVATYLVPEGTCSLSWPSNISARSAKRPQKWLHLMLDDLGDLAKEEMSDGGQ